MKQPKTVSEIQWGKSETGGWTHNKKAILEAVSVLRPLFKSKVSASIKVFERVVFDQGMMSAFDGQVMITVPSPWGEEVKGSCRGVVLYDMLASIQAEDINSRFEDDKVIFEGGISKLETTWMPPTEEDRKTRQFMLGWTPEEDNILGTLTYTGEMELAFKAALLSSQDSTYREKGGIWLVYDSEKKIFEIWASDSQTLFRAEFDYSPELFGHEAKQESFRIALSPSTVTLITKTFEAAESTLINIYEGGVETTDESGVSLVSPASDVDESFLEMAWNFSNEVDNSDKSNSGFIILDKEIVQSIKQSKEVESLDANAATRVIFEGGKLSIETTGSTITMLNKMDESEPSGDFRREYLIHNISSLIKAFNFFNKIEFLDELLVLDNTEIEGLVRRYVRVSNKR